MAQTEYLAQLQQESEKQKELIKAAAASKKGYKPQPEEIWLQKLNDPNTINAPMIPNVIASP